MVSEAHIINHEGHYSSKITLCQSEPTTFPMCALSVSIHNANTHIDMKNMLHKTAYEPETEIMYACMHECALMEYETQWPYTPFKHILFIHSCEEVILT